MNERIGALITEIYGEESTALDLVEELMSRYRGRLHPPSAAPEETGALPLTERDVVMITYGDTLRGEEGPPLRYLHRFLRDELDELVTGVHILPFCPYSSDDGFSIIDYRKVNPELGAWAEIEAIADEFRFMADLVLNHCSQESDWFKRFLRDEKPYDRYFITVPPGTDLSEVVRPRALPLTHTFETAHGPEEVWTTFSRDQVDLDFSTPEVLREMLDVFLGYVERGAQIVRLDAIAYLWKEIGTPCIHHPNTHRVVKLMRSILEELAPWVMIITETNVPHKENVSYFGDGDEAHLVYNFSLPPLTLHALIREDATYLQQWASTLPSEQRDRGFFNFCASHDGVGLLPAQGILPDSEVAAMIETVESRGGRISYKATAKGEIPYEMNVNYLSAIVNPALPDTQRSRTFLVSQAIMLALAGLPAIYVHSLLGSTNWEKGVEESGSNRAINREKLNYDETVDALHDEGSLRYHVFEGYKALLEARSKSQAFKPASPQLVLETTSALFALLRGPVVNEEGEKEWVLAVHNVTDDLAELVLPLSTLGLSEHPVFEELISGDRLAGNRDDKTTFSFELEAFEVVWLRYTA
ncbi:MAG: sugar phosphorylase [Spirochaetaceae bacterium]